MNEKEEIGYRGGEKEENGGRYIKKEEELEEKQRMRRKEGEICTKKYREGRERE